MNYIAHRRNTIQQLRDTPQKYGIEVDIRSFGDRLVVHHDPFVEGVSFDDWVAEYRHGTLILNVKEEGLEERLSGLMERHGIEDYFFLDQSFPFLIKFAKQGERRCAVRVSEFESVETALSLAGRIDWVWVDCFTQFALSTRDAARLKDAGFRLCLVSPELQGRLGDEAITQMHSLLAERGVAVDAICTKTPETWESLYSQ
jgi:hypothetical protein